MANIPTTEEIMIPYFLCDNEDKDLIKSAMVEFAVIHVEAALKSASENAEMKWVKYTEHDYEIDKDSILNSYPLSNIK